MNKIDIKNLIGKNTKLKYQCGVNKFFKYCEARNLSPIPTEENLCHFISETSRDIHPSSANAYLSGILFHFSDSFPEVKAICLSAKVRNTVKGCFKSFSSPIRRANAMLLSDIELAASFFCKTYDDLLFNAIIAMGFNGLHRLGELVESDTLSLRDDRKLIKRWSFTVIGNESYAQYTLPFSKTDSYFGGTLVIIPPRPTAKTCPLQLLMKYVVVRDSAFVVNPFLLIRSNGYMPSRSWFMKRLKEVFGDERSGHSLRAGGTTAYAQSGVRMEVVQRMG